MRIKSIVILAAVLMALPLFGTQTKIYSRYEQVRQCLLRSSMADVQKTAAELAATARAERQSAVAARAEASTNAGDIEHVRSAFADLSNEMIAMRAADHGERPMVVYCPMAKKSWLQPKSDVSNPYLDASMRSCGQIKEQSRRRS